MNNFILLAVIVILFSLIMLVCKSKSRFGDDSSDKSSVVQNISDDSVLIFHAPWCGHCVNSMPEFEKAVLQGNGKIVLIDSTNDSNKDLVEKYNVKGFPTIIKGDETKYTGARKAEKIVDFSNE